MALHQDLLWRYDPSDVDKAYSIAESGVGLARIVLSYLRYTDKSKRWLSRDERRQLSTMWAHALVLIDTLGTYDFTLSEAESEMVAKFLDEFLAE